VNSFRPILTVIALLSFTTLASAGEPRRTENVIVVTLDGFRWQDFFSGADESLIEEKLGGVKNVKELTKSFWRDTAKERREVLLPFIWKTIAKEGQIFGDATSNSPAKITNGHKFSYPGYSEMFCGFADDRIDSNNKKNNPNPSVLEFLNEKPAFKGKVAAMTCWDVFPYIFRSSQNGLTVFGGWTPIVDEPLSDKQKQTNEAIEYLPRLWPDCTFDATTIEAASEHIRRHKPRVLYVGLGETDEWGHGRRYDLYLHAAQKSDLFLAKLWAKLQSMPEYKDKTTLIVTTDHGRGPTRQDWIDHGKKVPTAEFIWTAVIGPDTPALGVRENTETTQSQLAATIAALVGEDFNAINPRIAPKLPVFKK
jgi:hypothetical protein